MGYVARATHITICSVISDEFQRTAYIHSSSTYKSHNIRLHRLQIARLSLFDNLLVGLDTFAEKTVIIFSITENLKCR